MRVAIVVLRDGRDLARERVVELRGSLHHYSGAALGWIVTTGAVPKGCREEATAVGATPIALYDGLSLAEAMEVRGVGMRRTTLPVSVIDLDTLDALRGSPEAPLREERRDDRREGRREERREQRPEESAGGRGPEARPAEVVEGGGAESASGEATGLAAEVPASPQEARDEGGGRRRRRRRRRRGERGPQGEAAGSSPGGGDLEDEDVGSDEDESAEESATVAAEARELGASSAVEPSDGGDEAPRAAADGSVDDEAEDDEDEHDAAEDGDAEDDDAEDDDAEDDDAEDDDAPAEAADDEE
jgi:hypothetical protein